MCNDKRKQAGILIFQLFTYFKRFSESDIAYLQTVLPHATHFYKEIEQPGADGSTPIKIRQTFFDWLKQLTTRDVKIYACEHGSVSESCDESRLLYS